MHISENTLDDTLNKVYTELISVKEQDIVKSTRGNSRELLGVLINIDNPRARLSRSEARSTIFSCLGELLWYLSGSNDLNFITYYISEYEKDSDDGKTIYASYGDRLSHKDGKINQIEQVIKILTKKRSSRQAVIQLFEAKDIYEKHGHVPCTCTLQFIIRDGSLNMFTHMRSNDAYIGLPHDIFAFTMMQEYISTLLGVKLGKYKHFVNSLHLYEKDRDKAKKYIDEGYQSSKQMPEIPELKLRESVIGLLQYEESIRKGCKINIDNIKLDTYWKDIIILLSIFKYSKKPSAIDNINSIKNSIKNDVYQMYVDKIIRRI